MMFAHDIVSLSRRVDALERERAVSNTVIQIVPASTFSPAGSAHGSGAAPLLGRVSDTAVIHPAQAAGRESLSVSSL